MKPRLPTMGGKRQRAVRREHLFPSFFMGGFECSTHKLREGKRLDLTASTQHARFAFQDYQRLAEQGMRVSRDGVRWHLIESAKGQFDFSSLAPMVNAAREADVLVIWDLLHFGWPDHYDIFSPDFVARFTDYARRAAEWFKREALAPYWFTPVNEISWVAWAGGTVGCINPFATGRGSEVKMQLVRCALAAIDTIREIIPDAKFTSVDPIVHVVPAPGRPEEIAIAAERNESNFETWEMLYGQASPKLGGRPGLFDVIGVNFYPRNEWILSEEGRGFIRTDSPNYKPFRELLADVYARFQTPLYISETGTEDEERVPWLRYVCQEVAAAMQSGIPVEGICLYPIVNHPGWGDDRHCYNGLWEYADETGHREIYEPLEAEIHRWQQVFDARDRDRISPEALEAAILQSGEPTPHVAPNSDVAHLTGPLQGCMPKPFANREHKL